VTDAGFGDKTTLTGARSNADRSTGPWFNPCRRLSNTAGREIYGIQLRMTWSLQLLLLRSLRRVLMYVQFNVTDGCAKIAKLSKLNCVSSLTEAL